MCVAGDEESNGSSSASSSSSSVDGEMPEIVVTAPRIGLDQDVIERIDWSDVLTVSGLTGGGAGVSGGGLLGAVVGAVTGALATVETQDEVDLADLFEIKNDMIVVRGVPGPYISLH